MVWTQRRSYTTTTTTENSLRYQEQQYQRDRARIIHSAAFRRLQAKTQIYSVGENDFYRTRLTHSLEVAQVASGICYQLQQTSQQAEVSQWIPTNGLIEALGLCHDIGHPPFGHGGEVALNYLMRNDGGFEGNGQTLRMVARLGEYSAEHGMDLSRRCMLGLIKYPNTYKKLLNTSILPQDTSTDNLDSWHPPKCFFDDEHPIFEWITAPFCDEDRQRLTHFDEHQGKHSKTRYKSFDTAIMEMADDISYAVHDFEDAISLKLISAQQWHNEVVEKIMTLNGNPIADNITFYTSKLFSENSSDIKHAISKLVHYFISNIYISEQGAFQHPLLKYKVELPEDAQQVLDTLKTIVFQRVIKRAEVQALEYKGQNMVIRIFNALSNNPERLLPANTLSKYQQAENPQRIICDYIAGMTDSYANKVYNKLFMPNSGSNFDLT